MPKPFRFAFPSPLVLEQKTLAAGKMSSWLPGAGGGAAWHVPNRLFAESMPFFQCPTPLDTRAALPTAVPGQLDANRPQGSPPLQGLRALALGVALR